MEDIELLCPCCRAVLGVDDAGDLFVLEEASLEPGTSRGIGGLTVVDADPAWREHNYRFNQQSRIDEQLTEFGFPSLNSSSATTPDPKLQQANDNDLKQKRLK
ncbi:hypothetical protein [Vulcanococcus sp.]|jgi:hypothetical protein|uniref:hypothetical protein n=1 Tax=Vulcanococcus sp. TaxID=2856995 RepID=UPI0037DA3D76